MKLTRGFIALISSILISAALLGAAVSASLGTFSARMGAMRSEYKKISVSLARSCTEMALLHLAENYNYAPPVGGESISINDHSCTILSVTTESVTASGKAVLIVTNAHDQSSYTTLHTDATIPDPSISSAPIQIGAWREVSTP